MREPVVLEVRKLVAEHADVPLDNVMVTANIDTFNLDSLELVKLGNDCEETFNIQIPTKVIHSWEHAKISDIVLYIDGQVKDIEFLTDEATEL